MRKTTVLALDVVNFSKYMAENPENTVEVLSSRRRIIHELIKTNDGSVFNEAGDSIVAEFSNSSYTPEILIPVDEAEKFSLIDTLVAGCQFNGAQVITLDGLRVEYSSGWGLIRASNTSANLTLRFEADDDKSLEDIRQRFQRELAPFINHIEDYI